MQKVVKRVSFCGVGDDDSDVKKVLSRREIAKCAYIDCKCGLEDGDLDEKARPVAVW